MVLQVCRWVLGNADDAEDAFQGTFLVLARKAAVVPRAALAAWLHGVARRVALETRGARIRYHDSGPLLEAPADRRADPLAELSARELLTIVDEEIQRLPERYRLPLVLCCLGGRSVEEAARHLGWTSGSVKGPLERGRARLHDRLARRGLTLAAALAAVEASRATTSAAVLAGLVARTVPGALAIEASQPMVAGVSTSAVALAARVVKAMALPRLTLVGALLLTIAVLGAGITIGNNNPVPAITSLSSTSANEGSADLTLTLTGSGFIASSVVDWNGAGLTTTYVSGTQLQAVIPAADLADDSSDTITVVNPPPGGGTSNSEGFTVAAVAPTAGISGPTDGYQGVQGQSRTFTLTASSPSSTDQTAGFTYSIQWGDNTSTTTPAGQSGSGTNVSHVYATAGSYTISVTATDDDNQVSAPATLADHILVVEQQGHGLALGGASTLSSWTFTPGSTAGTLTTKLGTETLGTFTASAGVVVYGQAGLNKLIINGTSGDDVFSVQDQSAAMNAFTFSGTSIGGWTFNGLGGNNTLAVVATLKTDPVTFNGGPGSAASGRSLLIGGMGASNLTAGSAGDILIAGSTNYNTNNTALVKILTEWQSSDTYQERFDSLQGFKGSGTGSHLTAATS